MEPPEDQIVDIPKERFKFFGGPGKMLLPGPATLAALVKKIPEHKLVTTNQLCQGSPSNSKSGEPARLPPNRLFRRLPMTPPEKSPIGGS